MWESLAGCDIVLPSLPSVSARPRAVVHFVGGLGAGAAPRALYGSFLEELARRGNVAVVATPVRAGFDHTRLASAIAAQSADAISILRARWQLPTGPSFIPVFGVGHSLGAKLHLLASADDETRITLGPRVANILIAFNNYTAARSIPMWDAVRAAATAAPTAGDSASSSSQNSTLADLISRATSAASAAASPEMLAVLGLDPSAAAWIAAATAAATDMAGGIVSGDFTPTPTDVLRIVGDSYSVASNLVIAYNRDTIDSSDELVPLLRDRFGGRGVVVRRLDGTHVTPNTPSFVSGQFAATGFGAVDESVRRQADSAIAELDETVTCIVAFLLLNLELLESQRMLEPSSS
jgi:Protein of unknown function (DUF1350)